MDPIKEITGLEQKFISAWNAGDAHAAAAFYAEDGTRVGASGDVSHGRAAIEVAYTKLFDGPMKGASVEWHPAVRLLAPEVAVAQGPITIRRASGGAPIEGYAVDVWKRTGGRWQVVEGHPKLFPPPPK